VWEKIKISWSFLNKREKRYYRLLIIGRIASNTLDLAGIGAIGLLVMAVASGRIEFTIGNFYTLQIDETPPELIIFLIVFSALAFLAKALVGLGLAYASLWLLVGIEVRSSKRVLSFLLNGSLGDLRQYSRGDIQFASGASTGAMFSGLLGAVSSLITELALMAMIVGMFFLVDPVAATVITIYIFIFIVIVQWIIGNRLRLIGKFVARGSVATATAVLDAVESFKEVSVLKRQPFFLGRFVSARMMLARTRSQELFLRAVPRIVIEQSLMLGVLGFVGWQLMFGNLATGLASVGVFIVGSVRLTGAILPIQNSYATLKSTHMKADLAIEILQKFRQKSRQDKRDRLASDDDTEEVRDYEDRPARDRGLSINLDTVSYSYPDSNEFAIRDISVSVEAGQFVAFVGPSGAGKTTIADIILGLHLPTSGEALIDGRPPQDVRKTEPGLVSYVPQKPGMVSGTILENIALGVEPEKIDRDRVIECVALAGLKEVIDDLPQGVDSDLGKQSDALSGGQLQRLGLARALYPNPRLIILDEATSSLDAKVEAEVSQNVRSLGGSVTVVVIAHRLSTIQHADCVYVVDGGRIIAEGPFKKLRREVPMVEEYVQLMSFDQ
jgi:ABC-type multidrug transport system fused ATPase/permease subunit